jgi:hypothetical protein
MGMLAQAHLFGDLGIKQHKPTNAYLHPLPGSNSAIEIHQHDFAA